MSSNKAAACFPAALASGVSRLSAKALASGVLSLPSAAAERMRSIAILSPLSSVVAVVAAAEAVAFGAVAAGAGTAFGGAESGSPTGAAFPPRGGAASQAGAAPRARGTLRLEEVAEATSTTSALWAARGVLGTGAVEAPLAEERARLHGAASSSGSLLTLTVRVGGFRGAGAFALATRLASSASFLSLSSRRFFRWALLPPRRDLEGRQSAMNSLGSGRLSSHSPSSPLVLAIFVMGAFTGAKRECFWALVSKPRPSAARRFTAARRDSGNRTDESVRLITRY